MPKNIIIIIGNKNKNWIPQKVEVTVWIKMLDEVVGKYMCGLFRATILRVQDVKQ